MQADKEAVARAAVVRERTVTQLGELMINDSDVLSLIKANHTESQPFRIYEHTTAHAPIARNILQRLKELSSPGYVHITATIANIEEQDAISAKAIQKILDELASPKASAEAVFVADLSKLPYGRESFDIVYVNLSMSFAIDDDSATRNLQRLLKPGGRIAITSWKSLGWRLADGSEDADASLALFPSSGWREKSYIEHKLAKHGFDNIRVTERKIEVEGDVGDYRAVTDSLLRMALRRMLSGPGQEPLADPETMEAMTQQITSKYAAAKFEDGFVSPWVTLATKNASSKIGPFASPRLR